MTMKILLVEDDSALRAALEELLLREGYDVKKTANYREARAGLDDAIDLVMLDVGLPDGDGVSLCKLWRSEGVQTPILFLTAKDEELDIVRGLDAGGNDYVTKPFRMQELLSRIRALLRRKTGREENLVRSGIRLDKTRLQAFREGTDLLLTLTEFKLLSRLLSERSILTRGALLEELWDTDSRFIDDNTLSVHISRLREKVGAGHIKTIRGVGYQWVD
ncbi:MAG: response regulator transcription factor [Oscillospiraceae bacterium]|nr:response regulator transcription factor [Oscillospiraceae bacterium]